MFDSENHSEWVCIGQIGERAEVTGFNLGPEFPTAAEWADLSHGGYNGVALGDRIVEALNHHMVFADFCSKRLIDMATDCGLRYDSEDVCSELP